MTPYSAATPYTECERPACPICDALAGGCEHIEAEDAYRAFRANGTGRAVCLCENHEEVHP